MAYLEPLEMDRIGSRISGTLRLLLWGGDVVVSHSSTVPTLIPVRVHIIAIQSQTPAKEEKKYIS